MGVPFRSYEDLRAMGPTIEVAAQRSEPEEMRGAGFICSTNAAGRWGG
ncbi:hypothetical protein MES5069_650005 [Mesorhizobium escarrei]|uniref:Uncharacterized protein n=1 Tax=Mesorhizobium escarrei TaxID=666018 RepID=A0ABM9EGR8_9HYPH|nr:hypothetical protein MES5069_650005 [Mesorhizobium escarrei]